MYRQNNYSYKQYLSFAIKGITLAAIGYFGGAYLSRKIMKSVVNRVSKRLAIDKYDENVFNFLQSVIRSSPQAIIETNLRSQEGKRIWRPLGSSKKLLKFSDLMFNISQLHTLPIPHTQNVDTQVVIGPCAKKPLVIKIPIIAAGMAYGLALSEKAKVAIAMGTAKAGTATNTGEGAFSEKERIAAQKLIIQYNRGKWNKKPEILQQADMIEIQLGQGAIAGIGHKIPAKDLNIHLKNIMGLKADEDAIVHARINESFSQADLKGLVEYLRDLTGGVPIGIKMGAGKFLEKDMEHAVKAGVDVIALDGAEAATVGSQPIIQDDFGLPTLLAVSRAALFFEKNKLKGKISLIVGGGLFFPGDFLKTLALGADAVYVGTMILFSLSHLENLKALPFEPPSDILWETGHFKDKFNENTGAVNLEYYLKSCTYELEDGVRALGKTAIKEVNKDDMFTLDPRIAAITGVDLGYKSN